MDYTIPYNGKPAHGSEQGYAIAAAPDSYAIAAAHAVCRGTRRAARIPPWDSLMFCPSCNTENDDRATSCRNCGHDLSSIAERGGGVKSPMLLARMYRAAMLDREVYEDLRGDPISMAQGFTVVVLATLALLVGAFIEQAGSGGNLAATLSALVAMPGVWVLQAVSGYVLGIMAAPEAERTEMARPLIGAIGLSAAPGMLFLFISIPVAGNFIGFLVTLWMVVTMITAVQGTLGIPAFRAAFAVLPGFVLRFIVLGVLFGAGGGGG